MHEIEIPRWLFKLGIRKHKLHLPTNFFRNFHWILIFFAHMCLRVISSHHLKYQIYINSRTLESRYKVDSCSLSILIPHISWILFPLISGISLSITIGSLCTSVLLYDWTKIWTCKVRGSQLYNYIITRVRLWRTTGESYAVNRVRFLYISRVLGHLS